MRFSPYDMNDYGLQHRGGSVTPITLIPYDEAEWNLYWASIPEVDDFLSLAYEDFGAFKEMTAKFPFILKIRAGVLLDTYDGTLRSKLKNGTPEDVARCLIASRAQVLHVMGAETGDAWIATTCTRLDMAQSLVDRRDAAEVCQSVIAVDFKARRRL